MQSSLEILLFGACSVHVVQGGDRTEIRGAKHRALFALLATAPMGRRSRAFLQRTLWGESDYESGHQNLRRALSDLRKAMGSAFDTLLDTATAEIELDLERVRIKGHSVAGVFLDGLEVREPAFAEWVQGVRAAPEQLASIHRSRRGRVRPRVGALPLSVPAGDPALRVLADWIAEETCRSLSRSNLLTVISHLSGRAMARRMVDIAEVRERLDVDYLVTGTLREAGGDYVADFDFLDAQAGEILWNRHLTCPVPTFSAELPARMINVVQSIGRTVAERAMAHVGEMAVPGVDDHQLVIAGVTAMHRTAHRDFLNARHYLTEALSRAPRSAQTHAWLGKWYVLNVFKGYSADRLGDARRALDSTARALDIDPACSFALTIDGFANGNILADFAKADARYQAALDLNPNESLSWLLRGSLKAFQDDGGAAIRATEMARRLSPIDPFGYYYDSLASSAHLAAGDYVRALELADRSLAANDRHISTLRTRITALHLLGRGDEARRTARDLALRFPEFTLRDYQATHPSAEHRTGRQVIEALTAAGIS